MDNYCGFCKHFVCGLHGNGYCDLNRDFLCYEDTEACDGFEVDYRSKRAFEMGSNLNLNQLNAVFIVTTVEYVDGDERDAISFVFDNEDAANDCFRYLSSKLDNKTSLTKEMVFHRFPNFLGGIKLNGTI